MSENASQSASRIRIAAGVIAGLGVSSRGFPSAIPNRQVGSGAGVPRGEAQRG